MKLRTACVLIPLALLAGVAGWRLLESMQAARGPSALPQVSPEVLTSGGPGRVAHEKVETIPALAGLAGTKVTTPAEVREVLQATRSAKTADRGELVDAALRATDPLVAGNAALALGRLRAFHGDDELLALVSDSRERVRQDAVRACGLDGDASSLPTLERALEQGDATLRPLVLEALGEIGGEHALALIQRVADDEAASRTERVFARAALKRAQDGGKRGPRLILGAPNLESRALRGVHGPTPPNQPSSR